MWIDTKHELPPDEWFFLPGSKKLLAIFLGEYGFPTLMILYNECGKQFFQYKVLYWQWIEEFPLDMQLKTASLKIDLSKPDLCEDLPVEERTPERLERRAKIRKAMDDKYAEEERLKHVRFARWVEAGRPMADPYEYAIKTDIGLPPTPKMIRRKKG